MRHFFLLVFPAVTIFTSVLGGATSLLLEDALTDRVLGDPSAPNTIIEYASLTCSHCKDFHLDVLPALKKNYIDIGKVKFIYRDFPLDESALRASMMARCAPVDRYFKYIDMLFMSQSTWNTNNPMPALERVAKLGGMSQDNFDTCMKNEALFDGILRSRQVASAEFSINSTPTFIINGKKMNQPPSINQFDKLLSPNQHVAVSKASPSTNFFTRLWESMMTTLFAQ